MNRLAAGEVPHLEPAREPRRDDDIIRFGPTHRGQQSLLADAPGYLVMLGLVAERPGHAAAAGVKVDHLRALDRPQHPQHRPDAEMQLALGINRHVPVLAGDVIGWIGGPDFVYDIETNRAVAVHTAAMTEALSKLYGAQTLVNELLER